MRQGDPLSPLIFYIAEVVLSRGLNDLVKNNNLNLIQANTYCHVPLHILFADDIMVLCRGDTKSLNVISELLKEYAQNSCQICNSAKSIIYVGVFSWLGKIDLLRLLDSFCLPFPLSTWDFLYLLVNLKQFIFFLLQAKSE